MHISDLCSTGLHPRGYEFVACDFSYFLIFVLFIIIFIWIGLPSMSALYNVGFALFWFSFLFFVLIFFLYVDYVQTKSKIKMLKPGLPAHQTERWKNCRNTVNAWYGFHEKQRSN